MEGSHSRLWDTRYRRGSELRSHKRIQDRVLERRGGSRSGVTGPDNDQDQTMTTLFGRSLVLKFQDQTTTT